MQFLFMFFAPSVITLGVAAGAWKGAPIPLIAIGTIVAVVAWLGYMTIPYRFIYAPRKSIRFKSVARSVDVAFTDIISIDVARWQRGFATLRYSRGSITLFRNMPGVGDLVSEIERSSPSAVVRGSV
jgi:hypothetical protein